MADKTSDGGEGTPLFTDQKSFEAWLEDKPEDWAVDLAMRSALRAGLFVWSDDKTNLSNTLKHNLILQTHRALFILQLKSALYTKRKQALKDASDAASQASMLALLEFSEAGKIPKAVFAISNAAIAAASASENVASTSAYASASSSAYSYARASAYTASDNAKDSYNDAAYDAAYFATWLELEQDAQDLIQGTSLLRLGRTPLWRDRPGWIGQRFNTIYDERQAQNPFNFWIAWYRAVVLGEPTEAVIRPDIAEKLALEEDEFWAPSEDRSAEQIMREICERAGWDWEKAVIEPLPSEPPPPETYQTAMQSDAATTEDWLERRPFARALAHRIKAFPREKDSKGLAINLHAPWGTGKTSVLKMIEAELKRPPEETDEKGPKNEKREKDDRWIVAHFNAWDHERRNPPWWALMEEVFQDVRNGLGLNWRQFPLHIRWFRFLFAGSLFPIVMAGLVATAFAYFVWQLGLDNTASRIATSVMTGILTLGGTAFLFARGLVFGSKAVADHHEVMTRDPLGRVRKLFESLMDITDRPVCIMIDDLDRCHPDFVLDLLEGIQTAFRHDSVVYLVAADRKWIKAAFEHRYQTAFEQVTALGQPLGYLFLDKIFQDSALLPTPPEEVQIAYWNRVIGQEGLSAEAREAETRKESADLAEAEQRARKTLGEADTAEALSEQAQRVLEDEDASELEKRAMRNTVYEKVVQSQAIEKAAQHGLKDLHAIIPFNPRALKRLANTLTLRIAEEIRAGRRIKEKALARWVVLEFSYPELADLLARHPDWAEILIKYTENPPEDPPDALIPYLGVKTVSDIFTGVGEGLGEETRLDADDVRLILQGQLAEPVEAIEQD